jgi:hypothetical protein
MKDPYVWLSRGAAVTVEVILLGANKTGIRYDISRRDANFCFMNRCDGKWVLYIIGVDRRG